MTTQDKNPGLHELQCSTQVALFPYRCWCAARSRVTCRLGLHVSGKLAANTVVVGADVVKAPASQLLGAVELSRYKIYSLLHL